MKHLSEQILESLGIQGEPKSGVIYQDKDEGIMLKYDSNTQTITRLDDGEQTESFDCSSYKNWNDVKHDIEQEWGIKL